MVPSSHAAHRAVVRCPVISADFFFQAEDGIRDKLVTGVQTCALPISSNPNGDKSKCPGPKPDPRLRLVPISDCSHKGQRRVVYELEGPDASCWWVTEHRSEERRVGKEGGCGWWRGYGRRECGGGGMST